MSVAPLSASDQSHGRQPEDREQFGKTRCARKCHQAGAGCSDSGNCALLFGGRRLLILRNCTRRTDQGGFDPVDTVLDGAVCSEFDAQLEAVSTGHVDAYR